METDDRVIHWARAYDALVFVLTLGRERRFRDRLAQLGRLGRGESVLDIGCGTGGLAIAARGQVGPGGQVCGVDPSPEMVARARRKAAKARVDVQFETAVAEALPFPDATFDAVCSSLMLHHLSDDGRPRALAEVARVLKPGGRFLAVDVGGGGGDGGQPKGHRHGHFFRVGRHGHFDLDEQAPVLETVGLRIVDRGPVPSRPIGLSNLRFLLAQTPSP